MGCLVDVVNPGRKTEAPGRKKMCVIFVERERFKVLSKNDRTRNKGTRRGEKRTKRKRKGVNGDGTFLCIGGLNKTN